jgi:hypothetical protein
MTPKTMITEAVPSKEAEKRIRQLVAKVKEQATELTKALALIAEYERYISRLEQIARRN